MSVLCSLSCGIQTLCLFARARNQGPSRRGKIRLHTPLDVRGISSSGTNNQHYSGVQSVASVFGPAKTQSEGEQASPTNHDPIADRVWLTHAYTLSLLLMGFFFFNYTEHKRGLVVIERHLDRHHQCKRCGRMHQVYDSADPLPMVPRDKDPEKRIQLHTTCLPYPSERPHSTGKCPD